MTGCYITTSWDDGHPLDLRLADLLAKYGLPGTFYIARDAERGRVTASQIRDLASVFEVGAHTLRHGDLRRMSDDQAREEIVGSKDWIEQVTGRGCAMFCFPMGRFRKNQLPLVAGAGYVGARTVELMSLDFPRPHGGTLVMGTTLQAFPHPQIDYLKNIVKRAAFKNLANCLRCGLSRDWARSAACLLALAIRTRGVFHLWGHSWEIEQHGQWGPLENVLRLMHECREQAASLTNGKICLSLRS